MRFTQLFCFLSNIISCQEQLKIIKQTDGSCYIGKTEHNVKVRLNEHNPRKVQNNQNTFEATSSTVLHGLSFQMLQKMLRPGRT